MTSVTRALERGDVSPHKGLAFGDRGLASAPVSPAAAQGESMKRGVWGRVWGLGRLLQEAPLIPRLGSQDACRWST